MKTTKKYKLTTRSIIYSGTELYQIKALKDFGDVKKGALGGHIQSEGNLSQEDNSWINVGGIVFGTHRICNGIIIKSGVVVSLYGRHNNSNHPIHYNRDDDCDCDWNWDDIFTLVMIFGTLATLVIFAIVGMVCLVSQLTT